ncbi:MAG: hypothetical protein PHS51_06505, partial [Gallionella sp.]|nr:hypothetical protein [Gallionella sp.]
MKRNSTGIMRLIALPFIVSLASCGGGGGGGAAIPTGPVTSTLSFPFKSADQALALSGFTKTFVVSGTCAGTG